MNTEAILFVGNLAQSEHVEHLMFFKHCFAVKWTDSGITNHTYDDSGINEFLKISDQKDGVSDE